MTSIIRRLDHVAIAVRSTRAALAEFEGRLGLQVVHAQEIKQPRARLTYLDCGNSFLQLVEPLDTSSDLYRWLTEHGEGIHHICFGVDDVAEAAARLAHPGESATPTLGTGRGRVSSFVPGPPLHGVRIECTQFVFEEDVAGTLGWCGASA